MSHHIARGFLSRCVIITVLLALLSTLLSHLGCTYAISRENRTQAGRSMHIAAATAGQRVDDMLSRLQTLSERAAESDAYQRLLSGNIGSTYEQVYTATRLGRSLEPYLSRLSGVDLLVTTFPDVYVITRVELTADTPFEDPFYQQWQMIFNEIGSIQDRCFLRSSWNGQMMMTAVCAGSQPVYCSILLNESFWASLTDGSFRVSLSDGSSTFNASSTTMKQTGASCTQPLLHEGWTLTVHYDLPPVSLHPWLLAGFLALWLPICGFAVYWVMSRRLLELHRLSEAMEARLDGKEAYVQEFPPRRRMRLSHTLLLLLSLITLISATSTGVIVYYRYDETNLKQMEQVYSRSASQIATYIDGLLADCRQALESIAITSEAQSIFHARPEDTSSERLWKLQKRMGYVSPEYGGLTMYNKNGELLASTVYTLDYLDEIQGRQDNVELDWTGSRQLWQYRQGEREAIRLGILTAGGNSHLPGYGERLGVIWMDFDDTRIQHMLSDLAIQGCFCAVYDRTGALLFASEDFEAPAVYDQFPETDGYYGIPGCQLSVNGWYVKLYVLSSTIATQQQRVWLLAVLVLAVLLVLLFFVCIAIERNFLSAIHALSQSMQDVSLGGTAGYLYQAQHPDEIKRLGTQFNLMLRRLDEARQRSVVMERRSREFEINMLQAQINPHFLYNTLRTVQVLILRQDPRAITVIDQLIVIFRVAANVQVKQVPLREELRQVEAYVAIQSVRFADRFQVFYEVEPGTEDVSIVRFCLQPLVENAISHGLANRASGGKIWIGASSDGKELRLTVKDNGCGMTDEELELLQQKLEHSEYDSHIGLLNVHQRIQLTFGNAWGLSVSKREPEGMCVLLRFPCGT